MPARILFVDDSATIRMLYQHMLHKEGFEVTLACDGQEALQHLKPGHGFHLVISDLRMPGLDGLGLVSTIREQPSLRLLPVLILTGSNDRDDLMKNLRAGVSDYFQKSGDILEFIIRVRNLTRVGQLQEELERISQTDALTQLYNRRFAVQVLETEHGRSQRYARPLSVALFDIDHFKRFNDTWGHQAGDDILVQIARLTQDCARDSDRVARWGGEEFLIVLPETPLHAAAVLATQRLHL